VACGICHTGSDIKSVFMFTSNDESLVNSLLIVLYSVMITLNFSYFIDVYI